MYHRGGGIVYHRHDEKGLNWEPGGVRSRGPQFRDESGVVRIIRDLGSNALPAVPEAVAVAVHLQDVDVVGEPIQQGSGQSLRPEDRGPFVEGEVGGAQDGPALVALADINEGSGCSATDTTLTVTDGSKFAVGQTILIGSEQLYITAISTNDLTVVRGVNGTTPASHAHNSDISIYRYSRPVVEACLMQTFRLWKRKDSGFASTVGLPQTGVFGVFRGLDPDVKQLLSAYRKPPIGVGTW